MLKNILLYFISNTVGGIKMKNVFSIFLKVIFKIATIMLVVIPFLNRIIPINIALALGIVSAILFVVESVILINEHKKRPVELKTIDTLTRGFSFVVIVFFVCAFIANYFNTWLSWWWVVAITSAFLVPIFIININELNKSNGQLPEERKKASEYRTLKLILFYLLLDSFYIALFMKSIYFQFITGFLCIVIVLINVSSAVISNTHINKSLLIHDFVFGISLTVYLIYIIPNDSLQNIILIIVSALFGGLMTLVGVAWTIKDSQIKTDESKRLEHMPFLQLEIPAESIPAVFEINLPMCSEPTETAYRKITVKNLGNGTASNITYIWEYEHNNNKAFDYPPINAIMHGDSYNFIINFDYNGTIPNQSKGKINFEYNDLLRHTYNQTVYFYFDGSYLTRIENNPPKFMGYLGYTRTNNN